MVEHILMVRGAEQMNVALDLVESYKADGWVPVEPLPAMPKAESLPVEASIEVDAEPEEKPKRRAKNQG